MSKPERIHCEIVPLTKDKYTEEETKALMDKINRIKADMWLLGYAFDDVIKSGEFEMTLTFKPCDCDAHREELDSPN